MPLSCGRVSLVGWRCVAHGRATGLCARCVCACFGWWLGVWAEKEVSVSVHLGKECGDVGGLGVV